MPEVRVIFYKEKDEETAPLKRWLDELPRKHQVKCIRWLTLLRDQGHDLRRPKVDYLRDGIYELRVRFGFENYRLLYFFSWRRPSGGDSWNYQALRQSSTTGDREGFEPQEDV